MEHFAVKMWKLAFNSDTLVSHLEYTATKISFVWLLCQLTHAGFRARIGRFRILRIRTGSLSNVYLHSCWWYQVTKCLRKSPHLNSLNHQKFLDKPSGLLVGNHHWIFHDTIIERAGQLHHCGFRGCQTGWFQQCRGSLVCVSWLFCVVFLLTSSEVVGFPWWLFQLVDQVELLGEQKNTRFCWVKKSLPILPRVNSWGINWRKPR